MNESASSHCAPLWGANTGEPSDAIRCPRAAVEPSSNFGPESHLGLDALQLVSINHRTAPIDVLERVALGPAEITRLLTALRQSGIEAVAVGTCNRTELYWIPRPGLHEPHAVSLAMTQAWQKPPADFHRYTLERHGRDAARHLFRVAVGLESLMLGEGEIMGQLRAALELAEAQRAASPLLAELFRAALRFGGRARNTTGIGVGAMSVASAAAHMLRRGHDDLSKMTVIVLGAGDTGVKAAQHLRAEGVGRLVMVNRTLARARAAAERLQATCAPIEDLSHQIAAGDALVTAVQAPEPIVDASLVARAVCNRSRPLSIVDLSLPRAVAPEVDRIPGVSVVNLSQLEAVVATSRERREREIPRVEAMLESALEEFEQHAAETTARPLVAELRVRAEMIRKAEVERAVAAGLGDAAILDHVTRRVVDSLLRTPSAALRQGPRAAHEGRRSCLECVFGVGMGDSDVGD